MPAGYGVTSPLLSSSYLTPVIPTSVLLVPSVNVVRSLSAYPVNSTCVILIWTLSPRIYGITSFVIEWKNLNKEEEMKWVRVPPNITKYYIYGECALIMHYVNCGVTELSNSFSPPPCFWWLLYKGPVEQFLIIIRGLAVALIIRLTKSEVQECAHSLAIQ